MRDSDRKPVWLCHWARSFRRSSAYSTTATTVGTTLTLAQSVLTQLGDASSSVQQSVNQQNAFSLNNNGQTATQQSAASYLDQILSLLNTQAGDNYMFSGSALNQPSVASTSDILNGNGAQADLRRSFRNACKPTKAPAASAA